MLTIVLTVLAVWFVISLTVLPVALLLMRSGKRADADVREQRDALLDGAPAVAAAPAGSSCQPLRAARR